MSVKKEKIKVFEMTCTSCEARVERVVTKLDGVKTAKASFSDQSLTIEYDTDFCNNENIKTTIKAAGYSTENSNNHKIVGIFIIVAAIILIGNSTGGIDMTSRLNGATYFVLFIVGALTSIHCVGMCGGIMLSQSINKDSKSKFDSMKPAILYNAGRVVSYTILGGIVGSLGSVLSLSLPVKAGLQIFAGLFMIMMGLNMSGYSLFRKFNIKLPWSACKVKKKPKTPFLVGVLNGLMPCGPLQTMQLYALGTGSAYKGALAMLIFSLGTVPLMLTFGAVSGLISKGYTKTLLKYSGILVVVLGMVMGTRGLALAGVNVPSTASLAATLSGNKTSASATPAAKPIIENGVQIVRMTADGAGYTPNGLYIQKNMPVKWIIDGKALNSCNSQIIIPSLNIQRDLKPGENVIEFTPKDQDINFSCGMGMIRGVFKVVDNVKAVDTSKPDASIPAPSSGMPGCNMGGGDSTAPATTQKPSIYGADLSKVKTSRLIHKTLLSGSNQTALIKGTGYEFEPLIIVAAKNINTTLSFDLNNFDNPNGTFEIANADTGTNVTTFKGEKGIIKVTATFSADGFYTILKDGNIVGSMVIVDDLKNVDLEQIRKEYLGA
ncbi:sulfite exporter TauE/SafE family protein [Clostridium tagluense]|uniref:urease accessory protein UreH domain-containing protein n=1 Tax=Clostridium tagluense TaxID=360422 RepID=UPI001C0D98C5|nr:sulfite exporter TauE/SafE family protein [Clostridium tagluense]MBU3128370.1 sulfite exporter TauE/SafE family protein [Clostridium tagluense]MCB2311521.1 sulfite exporter TauE/SafE family protein [Clostridium tagluense]MCB2316245.1 sulfite exporter TauE/SafE family protein [Clostridium tagluense]MCB2321099.1 sulfite exporter TauE/SafE family protein [Clostridium tagluense]MCB2326114.1 sulfite exporter TauE/SafE family protein [Clostridium tagluense]